MPQDRATRGRPSGSCATGLGSKMGVDATRKWPSEGFTRPWPDEIKMDPEVKKKIDALWKQLGL
jgi:4-hydroxy-3-polyprenylbenzoate decarboxylase